MKLLAWYLLGTYLFLPLLAAPFTMGASLVFYAAPFLVFRGGNDAVLLPVVLAAGLMLFAVHHFLRWTARLLIHHAQSLISRRCIR